MTEDNTPEFIRRMPNELKPAHSQTPTSNQSGKGRHIGRRIVWIIVILIVIVGLVQYFNAAKYPALVQVIKDDRIGVNPTGNALDFGDLPRNKSAIRTVSLSSAGNTASYIMIWKLGGISDLLTISKNNFTLAPHTNVQLQFTANIPNSAAYQYYRGTVIIFQIPKLW